VLHRQHIANLIRRLFQIGISKQSILLLPNLYQNAKSCIKWNSQISEEFFIIEQDRRGVEFSVNPFCSGFCESNIFEFSLSFIIFSIIFEYVGVMVIPL
jgi:hypothetical protein